MFATKVASIAYCPTRLTCFFRFFLPNHFLWPQSLIFLPLPLSIDSNELLRLNSFQFLFELVAIIDPCFDMWCSVVFCEFGIGIGPTTTQSVALRPAPSLFFIFANSALFEKKLLMPLFLLMDGFVVVLWGGLVVVKCWLQKWIGMFLRVKRSVKALF